jgi:hypothetical protein
MFRGELGTLVFLALSLLLFLVLSLFIVLALLFFGSWIIRRCGRLCWLRGFL